MRQRIAMVGTIMVLNLRGGKRLKPEFFSSSAILLNGALSLLAILGKQVAVLIVKVWRLIGQLCSVALQHQRVDLRFVQHESLRGFAGKHHPPVKMR